VKIYVAGKYEERRRIRRLMVELENMGHTISSDWTVHEMYHDLAVCAQEDYEGVRNCDALVAIVDIPLKYQGLWVEVGLALAWGKRVLLVGEFGESCIFSKLPWISKYPTINDLLNHLVIK